MCFVIIYGMVSHMACSVAQFSNCSGLWFLHTNELPQLPEEITTVDVGVPHRWHMFLRLGPSTALIYGISLGRKCHGVVWAEFVENMLWKLIPAEVSIIRTLDCYRLLPGMFIMVVVIIIDGVMITWVMFLASRL